MVFYEQLLQPQLQVWWLVTTAKKTNLCQSKNVIKKLFKRVASCDYACSNVDYTVHVSTWMAVKSCHLIGLIQLCTCTQLRTTKQMNIINFSVLLLTYCFPARLFVLLVISLLDATICTSSFLKFDQRSFERLSNIAFKKNVIVYQRLGL